MKLVFEQPTPREELRLASESLSDMMTAGMTAASDFAGRLMEVFPGIVRGFRPVEDSLALPKIEGLNSDQKKFVTILKDVPYSDLRELKAYVPEGMSATYLEFLLTLAPVTGYLMTVRSTVVEPYLQLLAKLVSDRQGNVSTNSTAAALRKMDLHRKDVYATFSKLYKSNDHRGETIMKKVVERNADWHQVLQLLVNCNANLAAIDLQGMQKQLRQCADYLDILYERLQKGELQSVNSQEASQALADGAFNVAQEMEFLSVNYYRGLSINGTINQTIAHTIEAVG